MPTLQGRALFKPESVNRENRTVEVVFTTGEPGERYDWWNDVRYIESLRVDAAAIRPERLNKGLSILDSHNRYSGIGAVLGVTEEWRIDKGLLVGTCRFSANQQAVFDDVADGILRHVSLGYRIHEYKVTKATKEGQIEKREATDWEPLELSIVPVSFETTNGVREAERSSTPTHEVTLSYQEEVADMPKENQRTEENVPAKPAVTPTEQARTTPAPAEPTVTDKASGADVEAARADIRKLLEPMLEASRAAGLEDQFAIDAYTRGESVDHFRKLVIDKMAETRKAGEVKSYGTDLNLRADGRQDHGEALVRGAEEAIAYRAGVKGATLTEGARDFTGLTMLQVARELLVASGVNVRGMSSAKVADRAFNSTADFPLILENVMNKNLLDGYNETPRTFLGLGRRTTVNDFRAKHMYRMGDAPSLLPLGENGEYKSATLSETKESYAIDTFARKIGYTRKMLINDDMGALDATPRMFGQAGSRLESNIVWGLLLNYDFIKGKAANIKMADGKPLFHADHKNLLGAGALSKEMLTALRKLGRDMKTMDGNFMNVMFNALAIGSELETVAEELLFPSMLAAKLEDQPNRIKMDLIVEPRISVAAENGYFGFSNMMDTFEYAYLAGEESMYTETVTSTDVDGLEIKVRHDFGAGLVDHRGMAMGPGA